MNKLDKKKKRQERFTRQVIHTNKKHKELMVEKEFARKEKELNEKLGLEIRNTLDSKFISETQELGIDGTIELYGRYINVAINTLKQIINDNQWIKKEEEND